MKSSRIALSFGTTFVIALLLSFGLVSSIASAADGDFDLTFDGDGRVITDVNGITDIAQEIAVQPDGKIVAVGLTNTPLDFVVVRYNPDGSLDTSFDGDGKATTSLSAQGDGAYAVAIQPDGKIVVAGYCTPGQYAASALARYNTNGSLDTTFGSGGKVCGTFSALNLSGVVIQPDGKIVASSTEGFTVVRFNADGTPDNTFGVQGRVTSTFFGGFNGANDLVLQPDGKILAAGQAQVSGTNYAFALARYLNNGIPDPAFGNNGTVTTEFGNRDDRAQAIALDPGGRIVLAGSIMTDYFDVTNFGLTRYVSNGNLDTSFGLLGKVDLPVVSGTINDSAVDVLVQPADGKIVVLGNVGYISGNNVALARLATNGNLDTTFGTNGTILSDFNQTRPWAASLAIQSDGKLVTGGQVSLNQTSTDISLARFLYTLPPTATPTSTRTATPTRTSTSTPAPTSTLVVCPIEYTDVLPGSTYYEAVHCLSCMGLVSGFTNGCTTGSPCFKPDSTMIRGDLAKLVSLAAGFTENYTVSHFQDVPVGSTYHLFVERLVSRSIMSGFACGGAGEPCVAPRNLPYFRPNSGATRGDYARAVASALNLPAPTNPNQQSYQDVSTNNPNWRWIESLSRGRLIRGFACGGTGEPCVAPLNRPYFRPNNGVTRGDASMTVTMAYFPDCLSNNFPR